MELMNESHLRSLWPFEGSSSTDPRYDLVTCEKQIVQSEENWYICHWGRGFGSSAAMQVKPQLPAQKPLQITQKLHKDVSLLTISSHESSHKASLTKQSTNVWRLNTVLRRTAHPLPSVVLRCTHFPIGTSSAADTICYYFKNKLYLHIFKFGPPFR